MKNLEEINLITEYGLPNEVINTHYGLIKRLHWQKLEVKRIGQCRIHYNYGLSAIVKGLK